MKPVLQLQDLHGGYNRVSPVLHGISFEVQPGEMIGLIGLNGAGKSTTMKHILGLMKPQHGTIRIHGKTLEEDVDSYRSSYAYVPESPVLYDELTVREHMELTSMAYGLDRNTFTSRSKELAEQFQMVHRLDSLPIQLSKGMRQKVMIMNAFLVKPSLYIIDEPFLGLDPLGIRSLLELMQEMRQSGASILMSSHILSTIESYCDGFVVLHQGQIAAKGTLAEISRTAGIPDAPLEDVFYALVQDGPGK